MFPNPLTYNEEEINELILARVKKLKEDFTFETKCMFMFDATKLNAQLPDKFYETYKPIFIRKLQSHKINNLKRIGFNDPFPREVAANQAKGILVQPNKEGKIDIVYPQKRFV